VSSLNSHKIIALQNFSKSLLKNHTFLVVKLLWQMSDMLDRLLAIGVRVMIVTRGNLRGCFQRHLHPVLGSE